MTHTDTGTASQEQTEKPDPMRLVGRVATATAIVMYIAYIPQIIGNLHGNHSSPVQPAVAAANCFLWVIYGIFKKERDLPVAIANAPGVLFGLAAALTAL